MSRRPPSAGGFTLIELLVAMAIGALMMMAAVPAIRSTRKPPSVRALNELLDAFREARSRAILSGRPTRVLLLEGGATLKVEPAPSMGPGPGPDGGAPPAQTANPESGGPSDPAVTSGADVTGTSRAWFSGHFPEDVAFRRLSINLKDKMQSSSAAVRFFANGTCDVFDAELAWRQSAEVFHIRLDVITGVPAVEAVR